MAVRCLWDPTVACPTYSANKDTLTSDMLRSEPHSLTPFSETLALVLDPVIHCIPYPWSPCTQSLLHFYLRNTFTECAPLRIALFRKQSGIKEVKNKVSSLNTNNLS